MTDSVASDKLGIQSPSASPSWKWNRQEEVPCTKQRKPTMNLERGVEEAMSLLEDTWVTQTAGGCRKILRSGKRGLLGRAGLLAKCIHRRKVERSHDVVQSGEWPTVPLPTDARKGKLGDTGNKKSSRAEPNEKAYVLS